MDIVLFYHYDYLNAVVDGAKGGKVMIDRARAEAAFRGYVAQYDINNNMIRLKLDHTLRMAEICQRIALSLDMDGDGVDFAWLLGLLHDIGRFEQARRYGTFLDSVSVDHAEFGADLLFREGLIGAFPIESLSRDELEIVETAIRLHNKLTLPEALDAGTRRFCDLLRDADKADIFRVMTETSIEDRVGSGGAILKEAESASDAVMACVYEHRCVPRDIRRTRFEGRISHCCMAFELAFQETRRIADAQGYLWRLMACEDENGKPLWNPRECEQLRVLRREIESAWGRNKG